MTQEDKDLLLKDLSARLPYGVIVRHADPLIDNDYNETDEFCYKRGYLYDITTLDDMTTTIIESEGSDAEGYEHICFLERTVPYLRPMSSMTEEEREKLKSHYDAENVTNKSISFHDGRTLEEYEFKIPFIFCYDIVAWLLENHFDFMGLIPKGLAIEVTEENNPYK